MCQALLLECDTEGASPNLGKPRKLGRHEEGDASAISVGAFSLPHPPLSAVEPLLAGIKQSHPEDSTSTIIPYAKRPANRAEVSMQPEWLGFC